MDKFKEIIDTYFKNYSSFEYGKVTFECDYGELIFFKRNDKICYLNSIYIFPIHRNKGFCREILHYIIHKCRGIFTYFCVESVISKILYRYLLRFKYENKKFIIRNDQGFLYKIE